MTLRSMLDLAHNADWSDDVEPPLHLTGGAGGLGAEPRRSQTLCFFKAAYLRAAQYHTDDKEHTRVSYLSLQVLR